MKSVVPHVPVATLGAVAASGPTSSTTGKGRVTGVVPADATGASTILVVGAPGCGKSSVIDALLGVPGSASADPGGDGAARPEGVVARPVTSAYLSFRHGDTAAAYAYVPGHRGPRQMAVDEVRDGDAAAVVRGGPGRPPRRAEILLPVDLLRSVGLVDTPGVGGVDRACTEIVLDALDNGAGLMFVAEAATALPPEQLDFLAQVEQRGMPVTFVLTKIDEYPQWPAVLSANQNLVHDHAPRLATSPWYAVSTLHGRDGAPPAVDELALGLAGLGVGALRRALTEPVPGEPAPGGPGRDAQVDPGAPPKVLAGATDVRWMDVLEREVRSRGAAVAQQVSADLATIHLLCVQETSSERGCGRLPHVFDRELHALSVRATHAVDEAATAIIRQVFAEILDAVPDEAALARIRRATHRAVEAAESGAPEWDRVLLVTSTSGIAVTAGRGAVASLAAVAPRPLDQELLPPIGVGLSAGCYTAGHKGGDHEKCRAWLQQAIRSLSISLDSELAQRFDHLREALAVVATDTIDHGVLLA
jgi:hypothetical protein